MHSVYFLGDRHLKRRKKGVLWVRGLCTGLPQEHGVYLDKQPTLWPGKLCSLVHRRVSLPLKAAFFDMLYSVKVFGVEDDGIWMIFIEGPKV